MARVLLIEDTEPVRGLFRAVLEQAGHAVGVAFNGSEGIRLFHDGPWDVVITDIYMPDGDGIDVVRALRRAVCPPKIIAISGHADGDGILAAAKLLGADVVLSKPVTIDELLGALHTLLGEIRS